MLLDFEERSISCISDIPESLKDKIDYLDTDFDILKINSNKNKDVEKENQNNFFESKKKIFKINLDEIIEEQSYELEMSAIDRLSKRSDNFKEKIDILNQCSFNSDRNINNNNKKHYLNRILSKKDINNQEIIEINKKINSGQFNKNDKSFRKNLLVKISPKNENLVLFDQKKLNLDNFFKSDIKQEIEKKEKVDKMQTFKKKKNLVSKKRKKKKKDSSIGKKNLLSRKKLKNMIFKNTNNKLKRKKDSKNMFYKLNPDSKTTRKSKAIVSLIISNKKKKKKFQD